MERWTEGFSSQREIFAWIMSSRFYNPGIMTRSEADHQGGRRIREARPMYQDFLVHAKQNSDGFSAIWDKDTIVQNALQYFGKRELYCRILDVVAIKDHVKTVFTGKLVTEWTGITGPPVRWIMTEVQRRLGGEEVDKSEVQAATAAGDTIDACHMTMVVWQVKMKTMNATAVRNLTEQVKEEMDKEGKLKFDWREAKKREVEQKKAQAAELQVAALPLASLAIAK